jgi:hypothetical protein
MKFVSDLLRAVDRLLREVIGPLGTLGQQMGSFQMHRQLVLERSNGLLIHR